MSNSDTLRRSIEKGQVDIRTFKEEDVGGEPVAWLKAQAQEGMTLLAHADDGVIWGQVKDGAMHMPPAEVHEQVELRKETLQMARLFDDNQEVFLWRVEEGRWRARTVTEGKGDPCEYLDEMQVLWGTKVEEVGGGFVRVADGEQGMHHAPPLADLRKKQDWDDDHPLRLGVRHYLTEDDEGWVRMALSRLTGLKRQEVGR